LFAYFLKIGAVLYGSGYVLVALLQADLVTRWGWLTQQQLLDAVAVGQVTPGPLFTTATFIGYLLAGLSGASVATLGIFLPAFVLVAMTHGIVRKARQISWAQGFLDGVNAASIALILVVTWSLGRAAIVDVVTAVVAIASFGLLFRVSSIWLIACAVLSGLLG
jgi:chromate transporter